MDTVTPRALTPRERGALEALIGWGTTNDGPVTSADRARWLTQAAGTWAGDACGCGTCPTIELTDAAGATPRSA
ncbi:hypothetical protein [Agromyces atrinae]|uniref:Uncharacterized protein n=1 Tax=Agromyces atrinae TaxID=592376 RepID=A0A4Q2MGE4_9MICO|nr:hypothetical protein [Agromyces atrinae]NYD67557.1 hypothetical protein [Agromyces atrinae]RXZ88230.1 hypothetical protein ESP50_03355 [Agromyces atrinae]